jgi:hypothetical protein
MFSFRLWNKVDSGKYMGELYYVTTKFNMTYIATLILNVIFMYLVYDIVGHYLFKISALLLLLAWYLYIDYVLYQNQWDKFICKNIMLNYKCLNVINMVYIVVLSLFIGYLLGM